MSITLFRKFGLHASADALAYREGKTCRTCVHLDSDPRDEPCARCTRFDRWEGKRPAASHKPGCTCEAYACRFAREDALGVAAPFPTFTAEEVQDIADRFWLPRAAVRSVLAAAAEVVAVRGVMASDDAQPKGGA